jgi:arylsulfatase A-like enzyme
MVLIGILLLTALLSPEGLAAKQPNIVVIVVDDMGYGDAKCFNPDSKIATPHIDSLARDGMMFTNAHAPGPLCHMSRYGLLTGRYPFRTDVTIWPKQPLIKPGQMTIASLAREQGYHTAMVGKWHLGFGEQGYDKPLTGGPIGRGFNSFFGMRASTDIPPYFYIRGNRAVLPPTNHIVANRTEGWSPIQGAFWRQGGIAPDLNLSEVLPRFTDEAVKVINTHGRGSTEKRKPLMLYLAYPAPHTPWLPDPEFRGKSGAGLYGDFMMMVDAQIGRVLKALEQTDMAKDTLVVFTSDNGPCWYETDTERLGHDSSGGLRGMKSDAWEAGHRMPFVVRWPGSIAAGSRSAQVICFTDLLATFAAITGTDLPPDAGPDSFNLLPVLKGEQPADKPIRAPFVMRAGSVASMMTIRDGDWKLITGLGSGGFSKPNRIKPVPGGPTGQLYHLGNDRAETKNLYQQHPEIVARLKAKMKRIVESGQSRVAAVDASTLTGKVMCGYQGWFNTREDGMKLGWTHWADNRGRSFAPGNISVDLWPDMTELGPKERHTTGFRHTDGSIAEVFSSANRATVRRHFEWMGDYGIDGIFLQRFAHSIGDTRAMRHKDVVLENVRDGAKRAGRVYAMMYDLTGLPKDGARRIHHDWKRLRTDRRITEDPGYLHHKGKPVVAVWGIGFNDRNKARAYTLAECRTLVRFLKEDGCTVMLGVPTGWRELERDAIPDPMLHELIKEADIVSPWSPGRYRDLKGIKKHTDRHWSPDVKWCTTEGLDYLPVVFPGFSWHNHRGGELGAIPRLKGQFLWSQLTAAKRAGAKMIYVAMFDEVDEGTAIFKVTDNPPAGKGVKLLNNEGLPSDHYLWLTGEGGRMLRGDIATKDKPPTRRN